MIYVEGEEMTKDSETEFYYYEFSSIYTNIVFHNNSYITYNMPFAILPYPESFNAKKLIQYHNSIESSSLKYFLSY